MKTKLAMACAAGLFSLSVAPLAAQQEGLVNVLVGENTVQIPIGVAAQVCNMNANVLAQQFKGTQTTACEISEETAAEHNIGGERGGRGAKAGDDGTDQDGLVNIAVEGNTVQAPISLAAQLCDINVTVLSKQYAGTDKTACEIDQETAAEHNLGS